MFDIDHLYASYEQLANDIVSSPAYIQMPHRNKLKYIIREFAAIHARAISKDLHAVKDIADHWPMNAERQAKIAVVAFCANKHQQLAAKLSKLAEEYEANYQTSKDV